MTINENGGFFRTFDNRGAVLYSSVSRYAGGTLRARAETLIHETAHIMNAPGFQHDFASSAAGLSNATIVYKNCRVLIEGLQ